MLIDCRNLSLGYDGRELLRDLSSSVPAGAYLCIIGENGSGKSTLMRTILVSILARTPVGSTIVAANIFAFAVMSVIGGITGGFCV